MIKIKNEFSEFYQPKLTKEDLEKNSNNIIVLDSNCLLDVIRNPTHIGKQYIKAFRNTSKNIYIPYLVALEFHFNKSSVKKGRHSDTSNFKNEIQKTVSDLKEYIKEKNPLNTNKENEDTPSLLSKELAKFEDNFFSILKKINEEEITELDNVNSELIRTIDNKIGAKYTQEWIKDVEDDGKKRYKDKLPPGFNDENKEDIRMYNEIQYQQKFGDLIIWTDIIEYCKNSSSKGNKLIYVTNDGQSNKKTDLFYRVNGATVGPHIHLMNELKLATGKNLYIISNSRFVQLVNDLEDSEMKLIESLSMRHNQRKESMSLANKNNAIYSNYHLKQKREVFREISSLQDKEKVLLEEIRTYKEFNSYYNPDQSPEDYIS